ncbi:MAG: alkaline phosphatase family protein [Alphaproteobacteria bacterium]
MAKVKNILFIMADQLRWDYLSCYGHPHLETPHIDRLAKKGVRFDRAYVQSPVCGPSRASCYTGRTTFSHGSTWNQVPLPIGEWTMSDYLKPAGMRTAVVGKTHMTPDKEGMERLGVKADTAIGAIMSQPGFEPFERDDGLHPDAGLKRRGGKLAYNDWLREQGYDGENPWHTWANSAEGPDGEILSGWHLRNSHLPARVAEPHSETAYMTDRAIEFIADTGDQPWCLHLSYIKPHWPYIAPAPYHDMYDRNQFLPVHRSQKERDTSHPVIQAFYEETVSKTFSDREARERVITGYMGLVKQIDDHLGRLFAHLEETGRMDDTMIVFTSDHGDYLGDHWMGEKELFHEASVRVPLIIYDPSEAADSTRGQVETRLVEAIDLLPTFIETMDMEPAYHRLEGRSLSPLLHGKAPDDWREAAFSEIDYAFYNVREALDIPASKARAYMIRTERWKYVYFKGFQPQLFDLENDPDEFDDLGTSADHQDIRADMQDLLLDRLTDRKNRVTQTDEAVLKIRAGEGSSGIMIGVW